MAKKTLAPIGSCITCQHADLHQWFNNPVISICPKKKGERFVASCLFRCEFYSDYTKVFGAQKPSITHHDRYE